MAQKFVFNPLTGEFDIVETSTGALPPPTELGQLLMAVTLADFTPVLPITSATEGWLVNCDGDLLIEGIV